MIMFIFRNLMMIPARPIQRILNCRRLLCPTLSGLLLSATVATAGVEDLQQTAIPASEAKQVVTIQLINSLLEKSHYRPLPLDDNFSAQVLERYLQRLDPGRSFFLQQDIDQFTRLETQFDDFIRNGVLDPAYTIFSVYRTRIEQRGRFALQQLQQGFDFSLDEDYLLNRSDTPWAKSEAELDALWRKRLKNDILNLRLAGREEDKIESALDSRYTDMIRRTRQQNTEDVFQIFTNAYVSNLEPHTSYFSPRATENFHINLRLSLEGIGAVLQTDNEYTKVRRIIPGGAADIAGQLKANDRIIGVGQGDEPIVDVIGWRLGDVVALIRGPKASVVTLEVLSDEQGLSGRSVEIQITRDKIKLEEQAAKKRILELQTDASSARIGVIQLPSFYIDFDGLNRGLEDYRSTTRDVRKLLLELQQEGIDGLVIDLRGNGGGALAEAIALTGLFIEQGPIVQVKSSNGQIKVNQDPDPEIVYTGPLAVLVNRHSASASEIFTGAIQDYQRGLVIGEPTFGKGTVQNLVDLNNYLKNSDKAGQLKITTAQFFRISGESTQHRGVVPDLIWSTARDNAKFGERAHENALPWAEIQPAGFAPYRAMQIQAYLPQLQQWHQQRIADNPEFIYAEALEQLNQQQRTQKTVSLHEQSRRELHQQFNQQRLQIENHKRLALNQAAFDDIDELELEYTQRREEQESGDTLPDADFFLQESGRILIDLLHLNHTAAKVDSLVKSGANPDVQPTDN